MSPVGIEPLGEDALLLRLGRRIDPELNARVHALARQLEAARPPWLLELVPAYASLALCVDTGMLDLDAAELRPVVREYWRPSTTPGDDLLAIARRAITVLELQSLSTDDMVFLIHPTVWEAFELTESTPSGEYKLDPGRQPINRARRTLWSVPVALSVAVPTDVIILFHKQAVDVYEREMVKLDWSEGMTTIDETPHNLFEHNQVVFRAEGRWAQCIYKPDAIVEVQLDTGS